MYFSKTGTYKDVRECFCSVKKKKRELWRDTNKWLFDLLNREGIVFSEPSFFCVVSLVSSNTLQ